MLEEGAVAMHAAALNYAPVRFSTCDVPESERLPRWRGGRGGAPAGCHAALSAAAAGPCFDLLIEEAQVSVGLGTAPIAKIDAMPEVMRGGEMHVPSH